MKTNESQNESPA